jgi:hypothetical protein
MTGLAATFFAVAAGRFFVVAASAGIAAEKAKAQTERLRMDDLNRRKFGSGN